MASGWRWRWRSAPPTAGSVFHTRASIGACRGRAHALPEQVLPEIVERGLDSIAVALGGRRRQVEILDRPVEVGENPAERWSVGRRDGRQAFGGLARKGMKKSKFGVVRERQVEHKERQPGQPVRGGTFGCERQPDP
jgi:hypothetical protein